MQLTQRLRPNRFALALLIGMASWAATASAATDVHESKSGVVETTEAHVLEVIATNDICDEGCKYYGPSIAKEVKLKQFAKKNEYYKWTHVSGIKTVKFFKHVQIIPGKTTVVKMRSLDEDADKALIKKLEKATGYEHDPAFDLSTATYAISPQGEKVSVKIEAMTRVGGIMSAFKGTVRKEMAKSIDASFTNFTR